LSGFSSGNIGTDLSIKIIRTSDVLEMGPCTLGEHIQQMCERTYSK
jgi:acetaldehyde dehydrogenase (acetylating)